MSAYRRLWFPKWLAPRRQRPARRSVGLKILILEDRTVPTTITVTTTAASGAGSLAAAISSLDATPGTNDTIQFSNTTSGGATNFYSGAHTITVSGGLPIITDSIDIVGPGQGVLTIDADANGRAFTMYSASSSPTLVETLSGMTIKNGNIGGPTPTADPSGGGVSFDGTNQTGDTLTISDCDITGNTLLADAGNAEGGGVFTKNVDLTMSNSTVDHNTATYEGSTQGYAFGGGMYVDAATGLTMSNSTISYNVAQGGPGTFLAGSATAGGIWYDGDAATLTGVTVTHNSATGGNASTTAVGNVGGGAGIGGGLYFSVVDDHQFTMLYSTVSFNQAVGGDATGPGPDTGTIYHIYGGIATDGGMAVVASNGGSETDLGLASDSTFDDNSAVGGTATLTNTQVGSGTAHVAFGGIAETGGVAVEQLAQCTVYNNSVQGGSASAADTEKYVSIGGTGIGGGLGRDYYASVSAATFDVYNSTFALNSSTGGTASNEGSSPVQAAGYGGGVGDAELSFPGISSGDLTPAVTLGMSMDVSSTILDTDTTSPAASPTSTVGPDIYGGVSLGFNLIGYGDASNNAAFPQGMFIGNTDPEPNSPNHDIVGPNNIGDPIDDVGFDNVSGVPRLADNGGPTHTVKLLSGGVAIDKGQNGQAYSNDQRGFPYVRTSGTGTSPYDGTDMGAVEYQSTPSTPTITYADTHWIGLPAGYQIPDADPVASGDQPGEIGYNAFAPVGDAITNVATTGEVVVNGYDGSTVGSGDFAEDVAVDKNVTLHLQEGLVTFNSLEGNNTSATVDLANVNFDTNGDNSNTTFDGTLTSTSGNTVTNLGNDSTNGVLTFAGTVDSVTLDGTATAHTGKFATLGSNSTVTFTGVVIGSHGTVEVGSTGKLDLDLFTSYGNLKVDNGTSTSPLSALTLVVNTGSSALEFLGGEVDISTPPQAGSDYSGFDLHGQNIVVANSSGTTTFRNNGFVADSVGGGEILDNTGGLVLGAGFFGVTVDTSGGTFRAGNSPGVDFVGPLVFGAGGITNLQFDIDDATGTAGPSPDSEGHVDGWSLITSDSPTWTADATHPLTVSLQSLTTATTAGNDVAGDAANFDPTQSYSWAAVTWTGTYTGPTDDADLNAATVFDTSAFTNSFTGTFGWHLDTVSKTLYLTYTPA